MFIIKWLMGISGRNSGIIRSLWVVMFLVAGTAAAEENFFSGVEDIPRMEGMEEDLSNLFVFDSPSGRLVEMFATGPHPPPKMQRYYENILPQMGWIKGIVKGTFLREDEVLSIELLSGNGKQYTYRLSLAPRS